MPAPANLKYLAFLSYAHADVTWGKRLHSKLEAFRVDKDLAGRETPRGPVPKSLRPIFRDREDFTGGHTLNDATIAALDASAALIVLCSRVSATRPAVNEEIRLFRWRHRERPVIPVIIDGYWPDNFPPALRFEIEQDGRISDRPVTILGPDLREEADGRQLGLAKIVAGLVGVGTDEIVRRAERDRQRRLMNWFVGLCSLVVALSGLTIWAELNRQEAVRQRLLTELAHENASTASSELVGELAQQFQNHQGVPSTLITSILLKAEALVGTLVSDGMATPKIARSSGVALVELSSKFREQNQTENAISSARRAISLFEQLRKDDPSNPTRLADLIAAHDRFGDAVAQAGQVKLAAYHYNVNLTSARLLIEMKPLNSYKELLAVALEKIAGLQAEAPQDKAEEMLAESIAIRELLLSSDPASISARYNLSVAFSNLANFHLKSDNHEAAVNLLARSLELAHELTAQESKNTAFKRHLGTIHQSLGDLSNFIGSYEAAEIQYENSLRISRTLMESDASNIVWVSDVLIGLGRLARVRVHLGKLDAGINLYEEGLALAKQYDNSLTRLHGRDIVAAYYQSISQTYLESGNARLAYENAKGGSDFFRRLSPSQDRRLAIALSNEAWLALFAGEIDRAQTAANDAVLLIPTLLDAHANKLYAVAQIDKEKAMNCFREAILQGVDEHELKRTLATDWLEFVRLRIDPSYLEKLRGALGQLVDLPSNK